MLCRLLLIVLINLLVPVFVHAMPAWAQVPARAVQYQREITQEAHAAYGLNAPIPVFAGQIEQESAWRPKVCSPFACGLTQFTAATAKDMARRYPSLASGDRFNPSWGIRALMLYDRELYLAMPFAKTECDRWAFAFSGYNGGPKWIARDRALCDEHGGCDSTRWFGHTELYSPRAPKYKVENRGYPRIILLRNQAHYAAWGATVACSTSRPLSR